MADWELSALAEMIAREQGLGTLIPVIEKELIHYDIFDALDELGLLNSLTFQGGTCLRLCYGAQRYSEDLDFCAGEAFGDIDFASLAVKLDKRLGAKFGANVRVRGPGKANDFGNVSVKRWVVVVDTAPARPDLPSQKVKIEVASVAARTAWVRSSSARAVLSADESATDEVERARISRPHARFAAIAGSLSGWLWKPVVAASAAAEVERVGMPESQLILSQAAIYVACAPKSNACTNAIYAAMDTVAKTKTDTVPSHLRDAHYGGSAKLGHGIGYKYAHDFPNHYVDQQYLPDSLVGTTFYEPTEMGKEKEIKDYLDYLHNQ